MQMHACSYLLGAEGKLALHLRQRHEVPVALKPTRIEGPVRKIVGESIMIGLLVESSRASEGLGQK